MLNPDFSSVWTHRGYVTVTVSNLGGEVVDVWRGPNLVVNAGKDLIATALEGSDVRIRFLGWGSDNTAPAVGQTGLISESGRKAVTSFSNPAGVGNLATVTYLGPNDAVGPIEELGWFAGPNATSTAGSGILIARVLYSRNKTNLESIQVDRTDTFS